MPKINYQFMPRRIMAKLPMRKLFNYDPEDTTTWPWIDCNIVGTKKNPRVNWIKNPNFKYAHLMPASY